MHLAAGDIREIDGAGQISRRSSSRRHDAGGLFPSGFLPIGFSALAKAGNGFLPVWAGRATDSFDVVPPLAALHFPTRALSGQGQGPPLKARTEKE
jgi:hypothetical protein